VKNVTQVTKQRNFEMKSIRTGGQEKTNASVEDMVLFTSHYETVLQCIYNKRSKWPASAWVKSMARACRKTAGSSSGW